MHILLTVLHIFAMLLVKHQDISSLVICFISWLVCFTLQGEIRCLSLLGLNQLNEPTVPNALGAHSSWSSHLFLLSQALMQLQSPTITSTTLVLKTPALQLNCSKKTGTEVFWYQLWKIPHISGAVTSVKCFSFSLILFSTSCSMCAKHCSTTTTTTTTTTTNIIENMTIKNNNNNICIPYKWVLCKLMRCLKTQTFLSVFAGRPLYKTIQNGDVYR